MSLKFDIEFWFLSPRHKFGKVKSANAPPPFGVTGYLFPSHRKAWRCFFFSLPFTPIRYGVGRSRSSPPPCVFPPSISTRKQASFFLFLFLLWPLMTADLGEAVSSVAVVVFSLRGCARSTFLFSRIVLGTRATKEEGPPSQPHDMNIAFFSESPPSLISSFSFDLLCCPPPSRPRQFFLFSRRLSPAPQGFFVRPGRGGLPPV